MLLRRSSLALTLLLVYWAGIFIATHLPSSALFFPELMSKDKLLHALVFVGLALLLAWFTWTLRPMTPATYAMLGLLLIVYAAFDEWTQAAIPGRFASVTDWLADVTGAVLGLGLFAVLLVSARARRVTATPGNRDVPSRIGNPGKRPGCFKQPPMILPTSPQREPLQNPGGRNHAERGT